MLWCQLVVVVCRAAAAVVLFGVQFVTFPIFFFYSVVFLAIVFGTFGPPSLAELSRLFYVAVVAFCCFFLFSIFFPFL